MLSLAADLSESKKKALLQRIEAKNTGSIRVCFFFRALGEEDESGSPNFAGVGLGDARILTANRDVAT